MNSNFFAELKELQAKSIESILKARTKNEFEPNYQFPYHIGVINDFYLLEAIYHATKGFDGTQNFIDPCCADGFSLILANKAGCNAYGLEIESALVDVAKKNIKTAQEKDLIDESYEMKVAQGDMFNLGAYKKLGKKFDEYDLFYLYALKSNETPFLKQFSESAKDGAKIIIVPEIKERKEGYILNELRNLQPLSEEKQGVRRFYKIYEKR
ncbi:MAG: class I SAM-dependent methyltransferase [Nanoarchaeota archaeon]|nr:class I SAM-dependent methyltransferase [Nanoarchaeota archaeon]